MTITRTKKNAIPLFVEPHPKDYTGLPFITLIQYRKTPLLAIIDNITDSMIQAYVLDWCGPEDIREDILLTIVSDWYYNNRQNYPISVEFARRGMTDQLSKIYKTLNIEFISRVIGPINKFSMTTVKSVKRRRKKVISDGIEVCTA